MDKVHRLIAICVALSIFAIGSILAQPRQKFERVLVGGYRSNTKLISGVQALGGQVRKQYKYVDALAVEIPATALGALRNLAGPDAVSNDLPIAPASATKPAGSKIVALAKSAARSNQAKSVAPSSLVGDGDPYLLNTAGANLADLHRRGWTGAGNVVAVIDTGLRPGYPHIAGSVVGCENFVDDNRDGRVDSNDGKCNDSSNDPHGTFVSGLIAAHADFDISGTDLLTSIKQHLPAALKKNANGEKTILSLIGGAPRASIYAFRAFGSESTIIEAIDRIIELRRAGQNIKVCNISFGGPTLFAGRDNFDRAVDALLENDIVPVISAGDAGPSSLTIASPGSSLSALTVGASSPAANERIFWDVSPQFGGGLGFGVLIRPFAGTETAAFSSRGPNADGRPDPDIVATGVGNFGQGYSSPDAVDVQFGGTSFSAPIVAGVAVALRQAHPGSTATQIRNALILSANPRLIDAGSGELDRGAGAVDASAADQLLNMGRVPDFLPRADRPSSDVRTNIERSTDLEVLRGSVSQRLRNLKPGERAEILYDVSEQTSQVEISLSDFRASGTENQLFGDDFLLEVHSAKTSQIAGSGLFGDYYDLNGDLSPTNFVREGTFTVQNPEPGVMRITIVGDTTNAGPVSGNITVSSTKEPLPQRTAKKTIGDQDTARFFVDIPSGVTRADFELSWKKDWSQYPTNDIDFLSIIDPDGNPADSVRIPVHSLDPIPGLDAPQTVSVVAPPGQKLKKGAWQVVAFGFDVPANTDKLELRVTADGQPLK